jgi:DNA-binding CsgD family transcriptional regulator
MEAAGYLFMVNVSLDEWNWAIVDAEQTIGRGEEASIQIPDRYRAVSRRHATIWSDPAGQIYIRDLGSRCGTDVNGIHLKPGEQYRVVVGDRVNLAGLELQVTASLPPITEIVAELNVADVHDTCDMEELERRNGDAARELLRCLSNAELEVVLWLCRGYTQLETIGKKLHRSPHTVRTQLNSIFRKLDVHSRDELIGKLRRANREPGSGTRPRPKVAG